MILELIIKYLIIITLVFCHEMGHILMCIIFFKCKDWKIDMGELVRFYLKLKG